MFLSERVYIVRLSLKEYFQIPVGQVILSIYLPKLKLYLLFVAIIIRYSPFSITLSVDGQTKN